MIQTVQGDIQQCRCEFVKDGKLCNWYWETLTKMPKVCPNCGSREWNGKKRIGRPLGKRSAKPEKW